MSLPTNPYTAGDPVGRSPSFVGREDVLRDVLRVLHHPEQNAITLYGQRRIGKTSVLQYLEAHLPEEGPYRPVYFDLMGYAGRPLGDLLRSLARRIARVLDSPAPDLGAAPEPAFRETWLPGILRSLPPEEQLILLMDEFDVQADPNADRRIKQRFFAYMRDLRRLDPLRLQFVFVLGRTIDDLDIVAQGLFKDLPSKRVSLLKRKDAEHLIRLSEREGSLSWEKGAVTRVWRLASGHPYLTQALCAEVWEAAYEASDHPPPVKHYDVDAAVPGAMERSEHMFTWLWNGLGPAERVVAAALAQAGPVVVDEERLSAILAESGVRILIGELRAAPQLLQQWDILMPEEEEGSYRFRVELLRRWIEENRPLSRVQNELDRLNPVADNLYRAGRGLFEGGNLDDAATLLQQALKLNPSHLGALELLGELYLAQDNLDAAQEALETLLTLTPSRARTRLKQIYLKRAETAEGPAERLPWYEKILALLPDDPDARKGIQAAWRGVGEQALAQDDLDAALRAFQEAGDEERAAEIARLLRAREIQAGLDAVAQLEGRKEYAAALEKLRVLAERYPEARDWMSDLERLEAGARLAETYRQALGAFHQGDMESAKRLLAEVIALDPEYEEASRYLYWAVRGVDPLEAKGAPEEPLRSPTASPSGKEVSRGEKGAQPAGRERDGVALPSQPPQVVEHLSVWNPLDYLRLLWWAFVRPQRLKAYEEVYGAEAFTPVGNRLAYTLIFLPLLSLLWGLALGVLPHSDVPWQPQTCAKWAVGISVLWLLLEALADWLGKVVEQTVIVFTVFFVLAGIVAGRAAVGVAVGVAVSLASTAAIVVATGAADVLAIAVAVGVMVGMTTGAAEALAGEAVAVVTFVVALIVAMGLTAVVSERVRENVPSLWALALLLLSYLALFFLSAGGVIWLETGAWPAPVWPF